MSMTPEDIVRLLGLEPLPREGGLFKETYRSDETVSRVALPSRYGRDKTMATAIFYLLTSDPDSFSALHKLPSDEVYHFYLGDPVRLLLLHPDGRAEEVVLGPDLARGERLQVVVPRDVWQGSRLIRGGRFALLGTTLSPGFDPEDYVPGDPGVLKRHYPERASAIEDLTRPTHP